MQAIKLNTGFHSAISSADSSGVPVRMVETNEQKIAYLKLLKEAIDSGNCKIVGNRITFYLPKDKAEKAD